MVLNDPQSLKELVNPKIRGHGDGGGCGGCSCGSGGRQLVVVVMVMVVIVASNYSFKYLSCKLRMNVVKVKSILLYLLYNDHECKVINVVDL